MYGPSSILDLRNNRQVMDIQKKDVLNGFGTTLVVLGVAVWAVYAVSRWGVGLDVTGRQFLPYHLAGVIPGMLLRRRHFLLRMVKKFSR
jgi:hypothetical protein